MLSLAVITVAGITLGLILGYLSDSEESAMLIYNAIESFNYIDNEDTND